MMSRNENEAKKLREITGKSLGDCIQALDLRAQDAECAEELLQQKFNDKGEYPKWTQLKRRLQVFSPST